MTNKKHHSAYSPPGVWHPISTKLDTHHFVLHNCL